MPRVGSSRMNRRGPRSSHLPITTFCWLPPERFLTSVLLRGRAALTWTPRGLSLDVRRRAACARAAGRSRRRSCGSDGSATLSAIEASIISPSARRSSVRKAMPRSMRPLGVGLGERLRRRSRSSPRSKGSRPNRMRASLRAPRAHQAGDAQRPRPGCTREGDVPDDAGLASAPLTSSTGVAGPDAVRARRDRSGRCVRPTISVIMPVDGHLGLAARRRPRGRRAARRRRRTAASRRPGCG